MSKGYGSGAGRATPDMDRAFIEQMIPHQLMGVRIASIVQGGKVDHELRGLYVAIWGDAKRGKRSDGALESPVVATFYVRLKQSEPLNSQ